MKISAPAFNHNSSIPDKYTCEGDNINPELNFTDIPSKAQSLVLIMDDPDIPEFVKKRMGVDVYDHWVVFNIPTNTAIIPENSTPPGIQGKNSAGQNTYIGPCPPDSEHRYFFKLYALDTQLNLDSSATKSDVEKAMQGHILEKAELIGLYNKKENR